MAASTSFSYPSSRCMHSVRKGLGERCCGKKTAGSFQLLPASHTPSGNVCIPPVDFTDRDFTLGCVFCFTLRRRADSCSRVLIAEHVFDSAVGPSVICRPSRRLWARWATQRWKPNCRPCPITPSLLRPAEPSTSISYPLSS